MIATGSPSSGEAGDSTSGTGESTCGAVVGSTSEFDAGPMGRVVGVSAASMASLALEGVALAGAADTGPVSRLAADLPPFLDLLGEPPVPRPRLKVSPLSRSKGLDAFFFRSADASTPCSGDVGATLSAAPRGLSSAAGWDAVDTVAVAGTDPIVLSDAAGTADLWPLCCDAVAAVSNPFSASSRSVGESPVPPWLAGVTTAALTKAIAMRRAALSARGRVDPPLGKLRM